MDGDNEGQSPTQTFILAHNRNETTGCEDICSSQLWTTTQAVVPN